MNKYQENLRDREIEVRPDCEYFTPKDHAWQTGDCQTDGHYLCVGCKRISPFEDMEEWDNKMRYYPELQKEYELKEQSLYNEDGTDKIPSPTDHPNSNNSLLTKK